MHKAIQDESKEALEAISEGPLQSACEYNTR